MLLSPAIMMATAKRTSQFFVKVRIRVTKARGFKFSLNNPSGNITFVPWGINGHRVGPGDYDGDGKNDFVVKRDGPSQSVWYQRLATGATVIQYFGISATSCARRL